MIVTLDNIKDLRQQVRLWNSKGETIGFVPTMGFLHEGHLSLIKASARENFHTIVSIFVNPTQFAQNEDLSTYPRDTEGDLEKAESAGAEIGFLPSAETMYPQNYKTYVYVRDYSSILCGKSRPTHFEGVTTVVCKLFNIVQPNRAYFGQKDAQQAFIIKKMVNDLNMAIEISVLPIVRETDGLAMSSRNKYLNAKERNAATILNQSLLKGKELFLNGKNSDEVVNYIKMLINKEQLAQIDYVSAVDPNSFLLPSVDANEILVALAVFFRKTRLIDNMLFKRRD